MKIGIIGSGHVGLVTGACFADLGNEVILMDHDVKKIKLLEQGKAPFYEPGLLELVKKNRAQGRISLTSNIRDAVKFAKIIFLCVGTPPRDNGEVDLSAVEHVALAIAESLTDYRLIVEKSTVPVATGVQVYKTIKESNHRKISFDVASNPEFLREGSAVQDFLNPDRIVIGVENARSKKLLLELYKPFKAPILVTDIRSAEMIKHASNSFLAAKISFINLVSQICEKTGADISKVAEGMGADPRIGRAFLNAGVGYGGMCFPKDLQAFRRIGEKLNINCDILKGVQDINEMQKSNFVNKVQDILWNLSGKTLAVLGLAFKPDTDDMRYAPSVDILKRLKAEGTQIVAYDPCAQNTAKEVLNGIRFAKTPYDACRKADALLILTEWREFRELDLKRIKRLLKRPVVIDGRNIYDPLEMKKNGFRYYCVGRPWTNDRS
mgnify:CR=1 FL=1